MTTRFDVETAATRFVDGGRCISISVVFDIYTDWATPAFTHTLRAILLATHGIPPTTTRPIPHRAMAFDGARLPWHIWPWARLEPLFSTPLYRGYGAEPARTGATTGGSVHQTHATRRLRLAGAHPLGRRGADVRHPAGIRSPAAPNGHCTGRVLDVDRGGLGERGLVVRLPSQRPPSRSMSTRVRRRHRSLAAAR